MEYLLKNGHKVTIRTPRVEDAEAIIRIMTSADSETRFLARNPGEFSFTAEQERKVIESVLNDGDSAWFVAEYEGRLVGQCSVGLVRRRERYRHRADVAFVLLKDFWGLGIGGRMMEACLNWCREHEVLQVELDVVAGNERALAMYRSFGFEPVGTAPRALRYPDGTFADEILMIKYLDR